MMIWLTWEESNDAVVKVGKSTPFLTSRILFDPLRLLAEFVDTMAPFDVVD